MTGRVPRNLWTILPAALLLATGFGAMQAPQEPTNKPKEEVSLPTQSDKPYDPTIFLKGLKPLPLEPIPDNPPPHEGAMFELTYRIDSPDLVLIEVLEALPGRQITGERLVRPDGTISLQWYGDVHVVGLTLDQVKTKVILHLRQFLTDESLGLIVWETTGRETMRTSSRDELKGPLLPLDPFPGSPLDDFPEPPVSTSSPFPFIPTNPFQVPPIPGPFQPVLNAPGHPRTGIQAAGTQTTQEVATPAKSEQTATPTVKEITSPAMRSNQFSPGTKRYAYILPVASDRVFVDVSAYTSKVYYIQGDVASPGRLTCVGKETVLDAINYAGGLLASADDSSIRLFRPARGNQRAREYPINYRAILRGDNKANLQIFPGDRLVVPRKAPNQMLGAPDAR